MLETRPDGPPNWDFGKAAETPRGPPTLPRIGRLEVSDTSVRYHDFGSGWNVTAELASIAGRTDPDLKLNASGNVQGEPLDLDITGPALALLENRAGPSPAAPAERGPEASHVINARIEAGQTRITASGDISKPDQLQSVEIGFELTSPDVTELLHALDIETAALPPIRAAGKVIRKDQVWQLNDAYAQVGESKLAGRLSVDLSRPRPFFSADLESDRLRAQDLRTASLVPPQPAGADGTPQAANAQPVRRQNEWDR